MRLSVIIPVHNSAKFISECLESIITQIGNDDEIVLVENGSKDNTPELCREYEKENGFIKYIELGAVGVSIARNAGIRAASGKWITFVDSDDKLLPGAFDLFKRFSNAGSEIIIAGYSNMFYTPEIADNFKPILPELLAKGVLQFGKYKDKIKSVAPIDDYNNWAVWGKFYLRDLLISNNIEFPSGVRLSEDTVFTFQAYCSAKSIIAVNQNIYYYRENEESVSRKYNENLKENNLLFIESMEKLRNKFPCAKLWDKEFLALYATKIIDVCWNIEFGNKNISEKKKIMDMLFDVKLVSWAINNAPFINLINGKKNNFKYAKKLISLRFALLKKQYRR